MWLPDVFSGISFITVRNLQHPVTPVSAFFFLALKFFEQDIPININSQKWNKTEKPCQVFILTRKIFKVELQQALR